MIIIQCLFSYFVIQLSRWGMPKMQAQHSRKALSLLQGRIFPKPKEAYYASQRLKNRLFPLESFILEWFYVLFNPIHIKKFRLEIIHYFC